VKVAKNVPKKGVDKMKLSTSVQMREMDAKAVEMGIPDIVLMENAAIKSFFELKNRFDNLEGKLVVAFVGAGNNGGDALAISRHLHNARANVYIYLLADPKKLKGSAKVNYEAVRNMGIQHSVVHSHQDLSEQIIHEADIIIDGLFGTGLTRPVEGVYRDAIELINRSGAFVLSVDIPSGVRADTGEVLGIAVEADLTPTFALAKPGHILYPGRSYCGELVVVDISTPREVIDEFEPDFVALDPDQLQLKQRPADSHKGHYGHLAVVGGSVGKSGAVIMASKAAVASGTGLVTAVIPEPINTAFEASVLEAMSYPVPAYGGMFESAAIDEIVGFISDKSAVCFGMGLGINDNTRRVARAMLDVDKPLLIDADGINALSGEAELLKKRNSATVLTPHPKELSRLIGVPTQEIVKNRLSIVREFSSTYNVVLVLKMADTLIATPEGKLYINTTGNVGLATGGSGDVLSGMIGAFLAQGYDPTEAAKLGVYLHGLAADIAIEEGFTYESLKPSDVIDHINAAFVELYQ